MFQRPKPRLSMIGFSLLSMLLLLLSACGATGTPNTGTTTTNNGSPTKGGTWVDDIPNEPNSLIPNGSSQTFSSIVDNQFIYHCLSVITMGKLLLLQLLSYQPYKTVASVRTIKPIPFI